MITYDNLVFYPNWLTRLLGDYDDYPHFPILFLILLSNTFFIFHTKKGTHKQTLKYFLRFPLNCKKHASSYNPFKICFHYPVEVEHLFSWTKSVLQIIQLAQ